MSMREQADAAGITTIALAAGACCDDVSQDLPAHLVTRLEDGPYGRMHIQSLDTQLLALVSHR